MQNLAPAPAILVGRAQKFGCGVSEYNDPYAYPGSKILRNRFGITDGASLDKVIHHHLFQNIYDWAGELRTIAIANGGSHFLEPRRHTQPRLGERRRGD